MNNFVSLFIFCSFVKCNGRVELIAPSYGGVGPLHGKKKTGPKVVFLADSLFFILARIENFSVLRILTLKKVGWDRALSHG